MNYFNKFLLIVLAIISIQHITYSMNRAQALAILRLQDDASPEEIRTAYKKLALQYHPDKHKQESREEQQAAEATFKSISEAYKFLTKTPDVAPTQEQAAQAKKLAIETAQQWVRDHLHEYKESQWINGKRLEIQKQGLSFHIKKFLKSPDEKFNYPGLEGVFNYLAQNNIADIKQALNLSDILLDKNTLKQEILKLTDELKNQENNPKDSTKAMRKAQENAEDIARKTLEQEKAANFEDIMNQAKQHYTQQKQREAERIRKAQEEVKRKQRELEEEAARSQYVQEEVRDFENIKHLAEQHFNQQREADRKQREEETARSQQEQKEAADFKDIMNQAKQHYTQQEHKEAERIRKEQEEKNKIPHPQAQQMLATALELATCIKK